MINPKALNPTTEFLNRGLVKVRYGISDMTLWRWENAPSLDFPVPMMVGRSKFYRIEDLERWERKQTAPHQASAKA